MTYSQPPGQPNVDQPAGRIVVHELSKTFQGKIRAVDQLSFTVEPGSITGFLGPNGAGKTTTLRMALGLVNPTSGYATIGGRRYRDIDNPLTLVGASLESSSFHPARTGRNHLRILCTVAGLPGAAGRRGPRPGRPARRGPAQGARLLPGHAPAAGPGRRLLGDPRVLVLDEPANGLDPDGIRWLRGFFRHLADEGRTILVSSHQLNEVQEIADRVVILNRGRLIRAGSIAELTAGTDTVLVRTPNAAGLSALWPPRAAGSADGPEHLELRDASLAQVGHLAFTAGVELHELSLQRFDLEQLFFALTEGTPDTPPQGRRHRRDRRHPRPSSRRGAPPQGSWATAAGTAATDRVLRRHRDRPAGLRPGRARSGPPDRRRVPQAAHHPGLVLAALRRRRHHRVVRHRPAGAAATCTAPPTRSTCSPRRATSYVAVFVLGVLGVTTEFRYQTITPTVLATPSRWALITAKMITYALVGALYALICMVVQLAIALPWMSAKNIDFAFSSEHIPHALVRRLHRRRAVRNHRARRGRPAEEPDRRRVGRADLPARPGEHR